jgi:hypothetical protein
VAGSCGNDNEPSGSIKGGNFLTSLATISFSQRTLFHGTSYNIGSQVASYVLHHS